MLSSVPLTVWVISVCPISWPGGDPAHLPACHAAGRSVTSFGACPVTIHTYSPSCLNIPDECQCVSLTWFCLPCLSQLHAASHHTRTNERSSQRWPHLWVSRQVWLLRPTWVPSSFITCRNKSKLCHTLWKVYITWCCLSSDSDSDIFVADFSLHVFWTNHALIQFNSKNFLCPYWAIQSCWCWALQGVLAAHTAERRFK